MAKAILNQLPELPELAQNWYFNLLINGVDIALADCVTFKSNKITFRYTLPTTGTRIPTPGTIEIQHLDNKGNLIETMEFRATSPIRLISYNTAPEGVDEPAEEMGSVSVPGRDKFVRHWYQVQVEWRKNTLAPAKVNNK